MKSKNVKAVYTIATVKNGKINWIAQHGANVRGNLKQFCQAMGEKVIKVKVIPLYQRTKEPKQ